ncbi:MAG: hypothetical protein ACK4TA_23280 [Saprospiraceae bacterium]
MDIIRQDISYNNKAEFEQLLSNIKELIDKSILEKYVDPAWKGRELKSELNGLYIARQDKKIYQLSGSHYTSTFGEDHFKGNWKVIRREEENNGIKIIKSLYEIKFHESGIAAIIDIEIQILLSNSFSVLIIWGKEYHNFIKSAIEFGIISAFEDLNLSEGEYKIIIKDVRYHLIDSSFSLLEYASNRNIKRAFLQEERILYPIIENGNYVKKFRPNMIVGKFLK